MAGEIIRVFPRKTTWTPSDPLSWIGPPMPYLLPPQERPLMISVTFTWDIPIADKLYSKWRKYFPETEIGGPAFGSSAEDFIPGMFLKKGITITSRGCSKNCDFCLVSKREGTIRELPIHPGNNVADNNLLACSDKHVKSVFIMLMSQKHVRFSGGLDSTMFHQWHAEELGKMNLDYVYFACDTPGSMEPLAYVSTMLPSPEFHRNQKRCYVLVGFSGESISASLRRLERVWELGFLPFAMLYRDEDGKPLSKDPEWEAFQRYWTRPALFAPEMRKKYGK